MVRYVPLRYYYNRFFLKNPDHAVELQLYKDDIRLIKRILRHIPWQITCLMESLIMKNYLLKYGIVLPVTIGVKTAKDFEAHAWYDGSKNNGFNELLTI